MSLIRKNSNLIGFDQGVSVKTFDKLFQQTRARFFPLANPKLSFANKEESNASILVPITKIPVDPGNGKYNLQIEDALGQTLKIRVQKEIKATASLTVDVASSWDNTMSFKLIDNEKSITFTCDSSLPANQNSGTKVSSGNYKFSNQGVGTSTSTMASRIFNVINLAYESGELNIKPAYTSGDSTIDLEQTVPGSSGNTVITLTNVAGKLSATGTRFKNGTLGLPRAENGNYSRYSRRRRQRHLHRLDTTAFALHTRGTTSVKQVASDLNKIINNSRYNLKSKIVQDNVLLIYQEIPGSIGLKYGDRTNPATQAKQLGLSDQAETYTFAFKSKFISGRDFDSDKFYDVDFFQSQERNVNKRYVDVHVGDFHYQNYNNVINGTINLNNTPHLWPFKGWIALLMKYFPEGNQIIDDSSFGPAVSPPNADNHYATFKFFPKINNFDLLNSGAAQDLLEKAPGVIEVNIFFTKRSLGSTYRIIRANSAESIAFLHPAAKKRSINLIISLATNSIPDFMRNLDTETDTVIEMYRRKLVLERLQVGIEALSKELEIVEISMVRVPSLQSVGSESYIMRFVEKLDLSDIDLKFSRTPIGRQVNLESPINSGLHDHEAINIVNYMTGSSSSLPGYQLQGRHLFENIKMDSLRPKPFLNPLARSKATLTVLSSNQSDWSPLSGFFLTGSQKSVEFRANIANDFEGVSRKVNSNLYQFLIKNINVKGRSLNKAKIITNVSQAISQAHNNEDLDVYLAAQGVEDEDALSSTNPAGHLDTVSLIQLDYFHEGQLKIKVTKRLEVVTTSGWDDASYFTVSDGIKSISLYAKTSAAAAEKVSSTHYTFGLSGATSSLFAIALQIYRALSLAVSNSDLDLVLTAPIPPSPYVDFYHLSRTEVNTNLKSDLVVAGTASENNLAIATNHNTFSFENFEPKIRDFDSYIRFKEDEEIIVNLKPNHDVEIRSFGLGENIDQFSSFHDISYLSGSLTGSISDIDVSPVEYLKSINGEFPYKLINIGAEPDFEFDGVLEPFPIREEILGFNVESKFYGAKAALLGSYDYNKVRNHSVKISSEINFEDRKQIPFFDQEASLAKEIKYVQPEGFLSVQGLELTRNRNFLGAIYSIPRPGIIFNDDRTLDPFVDIEERILQANPLLGNNPSGEIDELVSEVFELRPVDDDNLGAENFRRESGFTFGNKPHPGTDSIAFGGLKYV